MALKIRLRQQGRKNRPFYRMIVTETSSRRDGKYVECIGWYNPCEQEEEKVLKIHPDRLQHWLTMGAEPSEKVAYLAGKGTPEVFQAYKNKIQAKQVKETAKRRQRRKALAAKAS